MLSNKLKLNIDKTEVLVLRAQQRPQLPPFRIHVGDDVITSSSYVRNIGVLFDDTLALNHLPFTTSRIFLAFGSSSPLILQELLSML